MEAHKFAVFEILSINGVFGVILAHAQRIPQSTLHLVEAEPGQSAEEV